MDLGFLGAWAETGLAGLAVMAAVAITYILGKFGILAKIGFLFPKELKDSIETVNTKVDELIKSDMDQEKRLRSIEMTQMKKDVFNANIPYAERVWSAHKYLRLGGNGGVKDYIIGDFRNIDKAVFDSVWKIADNSTGPVSIERRKME
jgi:hypothetical protein